MPNPDFNEDFNSRKSSAKPPATSTPGPKGTVVEKSVGWGGLPGKAGPNRSGGTKKVKIYPSSEGI